MSRWIRALNQLIGLSRQRDSLDCKVSRMQYMGGKAIIARQLVGAILQDTDQRAVWYEPFVGGGNVMERAAPHFARSVGTDVHPDLIMMWEHVTAGRVIPEFVSREDYQRLRNEPSSWLRGLVGFGASFGGKWFGGYADTQPYKDERAGLSRVEGAIRVINRQAGVFRTHGVRFRCSPFGVITPPTGSVVYCDPPYAGTTAYRSTGSLDYAVFYSTLRLWARDRSVYVSEYAVPDDVPVKVIWERDKRNILKKGDNHRVVLERLFRILP